MARVLRPGGELRGTSVIKRLFGPGQTLAAELETSLADAGW
jgi:hypothetical protein